MKKIIIGFLLSLIIMYFFFRGVHFYNIFEIIKNSDYFYLILAALSLAFIPLIRSLRWKVILAPISKLSPKEIMPLDSVGYVSNMILPRVGDVLRPYLVSDKGNIPFSSALATTIVEKIFDLITIMVMTIIILSTLTLDPWVSQIGYGLLSVVGLLSAVISFLYFKPEKGYNLLNRLIRRFSQKTQDKITKLVHSFVDGLKIISRPKDTVLIFFLSLFLWGLSVLAIYNLFSSFHFELSPAAALVVLTFVMLGVSMPSAPASIGTFHMASFAALTMLGIADENAKAFAIVYHGLFTGLAIVFGVIFIFFIDFSFVELKNKLRFLLAKKPSHG